MATNYDDSHTDSVTPEGVLIGGCHYCPLCFAFLTLNSMPDIGETHWHCPNCGWWETGELIRMMMKDEGGNA